MNTTHTAAPDPGYYVPKPSDCLEAGLISPHRWGHRFYWIAPDEHTDTEPDYIHFGDPHPALVSDHLDHERELVFTSRAACMAFLRNHIVTAAEPAPASDWEAFISEFDQITFSVDERMDFVLKTHYGACAVLFAYPTGDYSKLVDKTVTGFKELQAKISSHLTVKKTEGGAE